MYLLLNFVKHLWLRVRPKKHQTKVTRIPDNQVQLTMNFMVAPYINNVKHFIVQLMHTNYKILRLLK